MVFGIHCANHNDPIIKGFYQCAEDLDYLARPGALPPIDIFPILKYIPERWAPWKGLCRRLLLNHKTYFSNLIDRCLTRLANGKRNGSYIESLLEEGSEYDFDREETRYAPSFRLPYYVDLSSIHVLRYLIQNLCRILTRGRRRYHWGFFAPFHPLHVAEPGRTCYSPKRN